MINSIKEAAMLARICGGIEVMTSKPVAKDYLQNQIKVEVV